MPVAVGWVALTAATGRTYHLAPIVAAAAPGVLARALDLPPSRAVLAGLLAAAAGWLSILILGVEPRATLWPGQPGGVRVETAVFVALGLAIGAGRGATWLARRMMKRPH